jgi:transcriptional regulator with XRE-family HTH domain
MDTVFKAFGEFVQSMRLKAGVTLREFCKLNEYDPGNISKVERGLSAPPSAFDKQKKYAECLGIKEGSFEWNHFFDLAAACAGKLPESILNNEELMAKLPLVFRTLRGDKVSDDKLIDLADQIRSI